MISPSVQRQCWTQKHLFRELTEHPAVAAQTRCPQKHASSSPAAEQPQQSLPTLMKLKLAGSSSWPEPICRQRLRLNMFLVARRCLRWRVTDVGLPVQHVPGLSNLKQAGCPAHYGITAATCVRVSPFRRCRPNRCHHNIVLHSNFNLAILDPLHPLGHCWNKPCPEGNASYDPRIAAPQPRIRRKRCRRERSAGSNHHEDTTNWGCFCTHYHLLGVWSSWCCNMLHLMCWRSNESNLQLGITWALASGYPACTQNQPTRIKESPWKSIQSTSWLEKPTEKFQHRKGGTRSLLWEVETRSWKSRAISPVNAAKRREHSEHH